MIQYNEFDRMGLNLYKRDNTYYRSLMLNRSRSSLRNKHQVMKTGGTK